MKAVAVPKERAQAVICDLDGTLCDDRVRRHFIDGKSRKYDDYHAALIGDTVNDEVLDTLYEFADAGVTIIYLTGRPEKYRSVTLDWFMRHDIPTGLLFMKRNDNTTQPAAEFKKEIVKRELKSFDIGYAIEDNGKCVEMFESLNIETIKVEIS